MEGVTVPRRRGGRYRRSSALDAWFPGERCGRPMLPEVRCRVPPSTCRPLTINVRIEHVCDNLWRGVLRTRTETVPERAPAGTAPGRRGMETVHLLDGSAPLGSHRTPHTYLCIVCDAEILIPPHTGPPFSGVQWPPRQTLEQPQSDSGEERADRIADVTTRRNPEN